MPSNVQQTSIDAYLTINNLSGKRKEVYNAIKEMGEACNLDLAYRLKWAINRVTPRTKELREMGLVEEAKKALTQRTGKKVIYWRITQ